MHKKAQGLSVSTIVVIIVSLVVLVFLIYGFSVGWGNLLTSVKEIGGASNVASVVSACEIACSSNSQYDYCSVSRSVTFGKGEKDKNGDYTCSSLFYKEAGLNSCPKFIQCEKDAEEDGFSSILFDKFNANSEENDEILKGAEYLTAFNTAGRSCSDYLDCGSVCDTEGNRVFAQNCVSRRMSENPIKYELRCTPFSPYTGIKPISCPGDSVCKNEIVDLPYSVKGKNKIERGICYSEKITCDETIKLYYPGGGSSVFQKIDTEIGIYKDLKFDQIKTVLPIMDGEDMIKSFSKIKETCSEGIENVILAAHGGPNLIQLDEKINLAWCEANKEKLKAASPFKSGGALALNVCSVVENRIGEQLAQCLSDAMHITVYASPCWILVGCDTGECRILGGTSYKEFVPSP
jgi:hypothetical protein